MRTGFNEFSPSSLIVIAPCGILNEFIIAVGKVVLLLFAISFRTDGAVAKYAEVVFFELPWGKSTITVSSEKQKLCCVQVILELDDK